MGQEELVLRIPADGEHQQQPSSNQSPKQVAGLLKAKDTSDVSKSKSVKNLTHSRESSGASVKFVNVASGSSNNSTSASQGHRRTLSKGSGQSSESHVIFLQSPSGGEDSTLSDRLSNEDDLEEEEDDLEQDLTCEDDFHQRLHEGGEEYARDELRLQGKRSMDNKSQNSDYGSFCNTPSDNFAKMSSARTQNGPDPPETGGASGASNQEGGDKEADDSSVMANDSYQRQPLLTPQPDSCSSDDELGANSSGYTRRKSKHPKPDSTRIDMTDGASGAGNPASQADPDIPQEYHKTFLAFLFIFGAWVATTTSLALTHERVPDVDPLPDVFLDNVHYQPWGLDASEIIIMVATLIAATLVVIHKHRTVVFRRIFFLAGLHYFYRAITMYITVLPKADPHYKCAPKLDDLTFVDIAKRVVKLLSGMGLSINGQHVYCGDYIYSGHTMTLLMTYLVIREYSPKRWFLLHWLSFCITVTGVLTLLFARGHYSIDVLIAYWITTRLWWIYHTLANHTSLWTRGDKHNHLTKFWWWYIFRYFEGNVGRPLPKRFEWPVPDFIARRIPFIRDWNQRRHPQEDDDEGDEDQQPSDLRREDARNPA